MEPALPEFDSSLVPENSMSTIKMPTSEELDKFFFSFLLAWSRLSPEKIKRVEGVGDEIYPLPEERGLMFSRPLTGVLVVRTFKDFESHLEKLVTGKKPSEGRMELFVEMVVLFWHSFVSEFWGLDSRKLSPVLFKKSVPLDWPNRKPDATCFLFVGNQPLEIRLWSPLLEGEKEKWKTPK